MVWEEKVVGVKNGYEIRRISNGVFVWWEVWNPKTYDLVEFNRRKDAYTYCNEKREAS